MSNETGWMPASLRGSSVSNYDAWLITDVEGDRSQERADYCADNHPEYDGDTCSECEAEDARWDEGPDPDDIRDRKREMEEDDAG